MATRNFPGFIMTNVLKRVDLFLLLNGRGAGLAPSLSTGDPNGTFFSAPVYVSTGIFTITTQDPYPGPCGFNLEYVLAVASATSDACIAPKPVQNANNTWTFTINCFTAGTLTDMATTSQLSLAVFMQNTGDPFAG
jgi:hypothetical protein